MMRDQVHSCMKYFSDKSRLDITAQLYPGLAMTYLPFLSSLKRPQCKDNTMTEADRSDTRLEMASLTEEPGRSRPEVLARKVLRSPQSPQPSLLHIAGCLLVVGLALILSLVVLAVLMFSPAAEREESQHSDLFNVLLVGGRGRGNSSLVSLELVNIGACPAESSTDLLLPRLPLPLSPLIVSHLIASNSISVCGADRRADWRCFTLRNNSNTWHSGDFSPGAEGGEGGDREDSLQLSQRHGAGLLTLPDRWLLFGGRR